MAAIMHDPRLSLRGLGWGGGFLPHSESVKPLHFTTNHQSTVLFKDEGKCYKYEESLGTASRDSRL